MATSKVGTPTPIPWDPFVSECRTNARVCTAKSIEIVTIAKVAPRVRNAIHATGSATTAAPTPINGSTRNGAILGGPPVVGYRVAIA